MSELNSKLEQIYFDWDNISLKDFVVRMNDAISDHITKAEVEARISELEWALSRLNTFHQETDSDALPSLQASHGLFARLAIH